MTTELERHLAGLRPGDHVCRIYETEAEQWAAAVPFVTQGLARGERCLYVSDDRTAEQLFQALAASGVDVAHERERGALRPLTKRDSFLKSGEFDPAEMIAFLRREEADALAAGFTGMRLAGEMTWALGPEVGNDRLIEYEARLNQFLTESRAVVLCQYNRQRFDAAVIHDVLRTHPVAVLGDQIYPNPYYEPPELVLGADRLALAEFKAKRADWWIVQLKRIKAAEQERERAERRIHFQASLLDQVRNAVIVTDLERTVVYWNKAAETLYQWKAEEVTGRKASIITLPGDDPQRPAQILAGVGQTGHWEGEYDLRRKDGTVFTAHVVVAVVRDAQGRPSGFVGVSEDVTDRKRRRPSCARNEVLQTIFDQVPVMIAFSDPRGRVSMANHRFEEITGWPLHEARERDMLAELYPDAAERQRVFDFIRNPPASWGEFALRTRDGRVLDTAWANVVLQDGTSIGIGMDVTERKRAQADRERLHRELAASHELLEALSRRLIETQEEERRNLARELHDEIGQVLTTVNLNLEALRPRVEPAALPRLEESLEVVGRAIEQVRSLSLDLRPASLDLLGLEAALRAYLTRQAARAGLALEFTSNLGERRLPPTLEIVLFRVAQEAMTNVLRHAARPAAGSS